MVLLYEVPIWSQFSTGGIGDIEGLHVVFDDLIISGEDEVEHDRVLKQVLDRVRVNNVKFNPNKFQFRVPEVTYAGQVVSSEGLKPDPDMVKAILQSTHSPRLKKIFAVFGD